MQRLSKEAEDRLLMAVKRAAILVDDQDLSPSAAITKVALDLDLEPGLVPLVVQAYNTGRTTFQREQHESVLDKFADFPIANTEEVMAAIYPDKVETPADTNTKTAVSDEYKYPPRPLLRDRAQQLTKAASLKLPSLTAEPAPRDPNRKMAKAYSDAVAQKRAFEEARRKHSAAKDNLLFSLAKLADFFKSAQNRFEEADAFAPLIFGDAGKQAMDYVYTRNNFRMKRSSADQLPVRPIDRTSAPYTLIDGIVKAGHALLDSHQEFCQFSRDTQEKIADALTPHLAYAQPVERSVLVQDRTEKRSAGFFSGALGGSLAGSMLDKAIESKPTGDLVNDMESRLSDPAHENALRAIQAKAELADYMANDDVISGYDPEEVLHAYNEISRLSPRSATQPAVIRPLLRKRLSQGAIEPFEAGQMADIEKTLSQTHPSAISSPEAPKSDK